MKRIEAIKGIAKLLKPEDVVISTTGMISRELFSGSDRKANFYMLGSMGLASSFGLGIALNSAKRIFILDGDGSALMDMGTIATIADCAPGNLVHVVLDNQAYQSTGGQPTISGKIAIERIAKAAGYREVLKISFFSQFKKLKMVLGKKGPVFILVKVSKESDAGIKRITLDPIKIKYRFKQFLTSEG